MGFNYFLQHYLPEERSAMVEPYVEECVGVQGFRVWIVDGFCIRNSMDPDFTNYGHHYLFPFIPENEFWLDLNCGQIKEDQYFIKRMLTEVELFRKGICRDIVMNLANLVEDEARARDPWEFDAKNPFPYIKAKQLNEPGSDVKVWLVKGAYVRTFVYSEFTHGGHDRIYCFIPKNEVWIDDSVTEEERPYIVFHEMHERNLMLQGMAYDPAHYRTLEVEMQLRKNPEGLQEKIREEFKKAERMLCLK